MLWEKIHGNPEIGDIGHKDNKVVMSMRFIADHGFRYCAEVNDQGEMERGASRLDIWCRVIWALMWAIFLLFLFIIL